MKPGPIIVQAFLLCVVSVIIASGVAEAGELTLSDGLRTVAEKSRNISISITDENMAEADTRIAYSKMLPSVNASAAWTSLAHQPSALFGPRPIPLSEADFYSYSLNVQQTLYDFRGNAARYDASRSVLAARKYETRRTSNLAAIEFVLAYLDLLEQEKMIDVASQEVQTLEAHSRNAGSFFDEGVITKNDLLQAEVKLSDARQRLLTRRMMRSVQAARLNSILVRPLSSDVTVRDIEDPGHPGMDMAGLDTAMQLAEQQRVELRIADETMKALGFEQTARRSEFFPKLFVRGGYDFTENRYQLHEGNWSVTLGLNMNIFSGGSTKAELGRLELQKEKLAEQRAKLLDEIRLEVQQAVLRTVTAKERLKVADAAVDQAGENLRINRVRYEEGVGTGTDVLDAIALLANARTNRYRAEYDLRKSEAAVLYATGRDLLEVYK